MSLKSIRGRSTVIGPAKEYTSPSPLAAANYPGAWRFTDGRMAYSDGVQWQELISNISLVVTKTVGPAGSGADFLTLGEALAYFAGFAPTAAQYLFLGEVIILNNHTLIDQTLMSDQDLGWVIIRSQALTTVSVERTSTVSTVEFSTPHGLSVGRTFALHKCTDISFNTQQGTVTGVPSPTKIEYIQAVSDVPNTADTTGECYVDINVDVSMWTETDAVGEGLGGYMPLLSFVGGAVPIIDCRFKKINTPPTNPDTGNPYFTFGLVMRGSTFVTVANPPNAKPPPVTWAYKAGFYGFHENIRVGSGSNARINALELADATGTNLLVANSRAFFLNCRARGTATNNVFVTFASVCGIADSDCQKTSGVNTSTDMRIADGSILSVNAFSLGGTSEDEIVPTGSGIVFDRRLALIPTWGGFIKPEAYTVATLPVASAYPGTVVYVSDETGGATLAFSDGTDWRRVQDRIVVS